MHLQALKVAVESNIYNILNSNIFPISPQPNDQRMSGQEQERPLPSNNRMDAAAAERSTFQNPAVGDSRQVADDSSDLSIEVTCTSIALPIRFFFFLVSQTSLIFASLGAVLTSSKLANTADIFWPFSVLALTVVITSNPLNVERESLAIRMLCFSAFVPFVLVGTTTDLWQETAFGVALAPVFFVISVPIVRKIAALPQKSLHEMVVVNLIKSTPGALGSLLYLSTSAMRCVSRSPPEVNVMESCFNPIFPSFAINVFVFITWLFRTIILPLSEGARGHRAITSTDLAQLRLTKLFMLQGILLTGLSICALIMFALLDENGTGPDPLIRCIDMLFWPFLLGLIAACLWEPLLEQMWIKVMSRMCLGQGSGAAERGAAEKGEEEEETRKGSIVSLGSYMV